MPLNLNQKVGAYTHIILEDGREILIGCTKASGSQAQLTFEFPKGVRVENELLYKRKQIEKDKNNIISG